MFAAGPPVPGFEAIHPSSAGRIFQTRYTLGGGDQLVQLGDVGAHPYEVEAAHLGDAALTAWRPISWQEWVIPVLVGAGIGIGLAYWFAIGE